MTVPQRLPMAGPQWRRVFVMTTAVLAADVAAVILFGLATASRILEDISAEELGTRG